MVEVKQTLQIKTTKQYYYHKSKGINSVLTLKQACLLDYQEAQYAFKNSMIHGILQFTLLIAFGCVLHRCQNQEIHC